MHHDIRVSLVEVSLDEHVVVWLHHSLSLQLLTILE
jgi:hypothetical protein